MSLRYDAELEEYFDAAYDRYCQVIAAARKAHLPEVVIAGKVLLLGRFY